MATAPAHPSDPPMAEPGKRQSGADVGGMAKSSAAAGSAPGADPLPPPSSENRTTAAPTPAPGKAAVDAGVKHGDADDDDEWRHPPVAPVDEKNPFKSLGKAVGDTVTGSEDTPAAPLR